MLIEQELKGAAKLLPRDDLTWDPAKLQLLATFHHSLVRAACGVRRAACGDQTRRGTAQAARLTSKRDETALAPARGGSAGGSQAWLSGRLAALRHSEASSVASPSLPTATVMGGGSRAPVRTNGDGPPVAAPPPSGAQLLQTAPWILDLVRPAGTASRTTSCGGRATGSREWLVGWHTTPRWRRTGAGG